MALADRRRAVGYTQERLAQLLGVERSTVVRWEAGETTPQPWYRPKLAEALGMSLDALHELLAPRGEPPSQPHDALLLSLLGDMTSAQIGIPVNRFAAMDVTSRRDVLQELAIVSGAFLLQPIRRWLPAALVACSATTHEFASDAALDALEQAVAVFRRWDASGVGGLRRKAVVGQLTAVADALHESPSPAVRRRLFHVTAELAQLAGWMAYDQGLPGVAQRYYLLALSACQQARAPILGAKVLGDMTQLSTTHRHYEDSLDLLHTALCLLPRNDSALVRSELLGLESRAHAHLGNHSKAARAADACFETWQEADGQAAPDWLHYMNQAEVHCLVTNTYV